MDIGSILMLLALVVIVGAYIASPLRQRTQADREVDIDLSQLLAERERILDALAELDFDNDMGKVPDDLYPAQREVLLKRGAAVLRMLDERKNGQEKPAEEDPERAQRLERAASIRATNGDPLEALIASRRADRVPMSAGTEAQPGKAAKFCPNCGNAIKPDDRFCPACGTKLS